MTLDDLILERLEVRGRAVLSHDQARRQKALWHIVEACKLIGDDPRIALKIAIGVASTQSWLSVPEVLEILEELSGKPPAKWVN